MSKVCSLSFGGNENVLKLTAVIVAYLWEHTKIHRIVHLERVNFMVCEIHLNKKISVVVLVVV